MITMIAPDGVKPVDLHFESDKLLIMFWSLVIEI